ncbi:hypothetical protein K492DRAFT_205560 [Lichtheimia hyalospora FSU 10163]|nr:hypothetical protein K492DRAFT_205560 [Lichtheimia hyalospora FSU 10163]
MSDPDQHYTDPEEIRKALRLRDAGVLPPALNTLRDQLQEATKIRVDPMEKQTRPLVEYVQQCQDASDLLDLWDYQANKNLQNLECLVPEVIALFMKLCTTPIIRPFDTRMKYITRGLASGGIPLVMATFKLLEAMCSLGQSAASALFHNFNFQSEGFLRSARYRQKNKTKNPKRYLYDLRTQYVRFVLAFFIHADAGIKRQILSIKNFVHAVFNSIDEDAYPLIQEIFSTVKQHLIDDTHVPRYNKTFFFSHQILEKIAKLYNRREPEIIGEDETGIPADLAHEFLLSICTVPGEGICYKDYGWYPVASATETQGTQSSSTKIRNKTLSRFIALLKPADDIRQQQLLLKILSACPELVSGYFQSIATSIEPRLSSKWLARMTLVQKVIRFPVPSLYYGDSDVYPATPPSVNTILDNILPNTFGRVVSTRGLKNASPLVSYATILLLTASFLKYDDVARAIEKVISISKVEGISKWHECLSQLRDGFRKRLPDVLTVVSVYQSTHTRTEIGADEAEMKAQQEMIQDSTLRLLRFYQQYLPEAMMEAMVDPASFIPTDILTMRPESLVNLLDMLSNVPDLRWTNKAAKTSLSHITTLLALYLQSPHKHIQQLTIKLINQTLADSFMFRHDPTEVRMWIEALPRNHVDGTTLTDQQTTILRFLDECIDRFNGAQYRYMDQLSQLMERAASKHNDQSLLMQTLVQAADAQSYPFSALLLTVLQHMQTFKGNKKIIMAYVTSLVIQLIAKQKVPIYLQQVCDMLYQQCSDQASNVSPCSVTVWDSFNMVQQAYACLSVALTSSSSDDGDSFDQALVQNILSGNDDLIDQRQRMVELLQSLPVTVTDHHLKSLAQHCEEKLQWKSFEPLVEYISQRHPLAGSVFNYTDINAIDSLENQDDHGVMIRLIKALPFDILFYNIWQLHDSNQVATELLKSALQDFDAQRLAHALSLILEKLSVFVDKGDTNIAPLELAFTLISHIFTLANDNQDQLKALIIDHPVMNELKSRLIHQIECLETQQYENINPEFIRIVVKHVKLFDYTHDILGHLIKVDSLGLNDKQLQNDICQLLLSLMDDACKMSNVQLEERAFERIAKLWRAWSPSVLEQGMLSLLNSCVDNHPDGIPILLDSCNDLLLRYIFDGGDCRIPLEVIQQSCSTSGINVAKLVQEAINGQEKWSVLSPMLVGVVQIGYESNDDDDRCAYAIKTLEKFLGILAKPILVDVHDAFYDRLATFMDLTEVDWTMLDRECVRDFVLNTILDNIGDAAAIRLTATLVDKAYHNINKREPIETYMRRVLDHEQYQTLTNPENDNEQRRSVIRLVHVLHGLQPDILATQHGLLDPLLTGYGATTSRPDRTILDILRSCEARGHGTILPKMLLWGPGSDKARQAHAQAGTLLHADTISMVTFGLIDPDLMEYTWTHFPDNITLGAPETPTQNDKPVYDPAFFLPLFGNLIANGAVDCKRFLECKALGMVLVSLSCQDIQVRMLGFQMMDQFYALLQHSKIIEVAQLIYLLDTLRNSIEGRHNQDEPPRIPAAVTVTVAHAVCVLLDPTHYMYSHISRLILQYPNFDLNYVPMFNWVFSSATPTHRKERLWLLQVLASSIRTYEDYKIFTRRQVWDLIMSFYSSVMADQPSKKTIIEIMQHAVDIPRVGSSLVRNQGLQAWIYQILALSRDDDEKHTWDTLLQQVNHVDID